LEFDPRWFSGEVRADVFVYYPVVVAEDFVTFDERLDRLLDIKRRLRTIS
jgi:hypothetical protein